ncbi:hypothetical protein KP509_35G026600 [Ceratopteris richardii]|uniref:Peroxidase n=1 Tax=Ceratopteris richardii TaxID=49495 RepID=A0A8T2QFD2_CERRI|nr:hypothetical protein KP509_35G026600 [Ceratopteris richardii]
MAGVIRRRIGQGGRVPSEALPLMSMIVLLILVHVDVGSGNDDGSVKMMVVADDICQLSPAFYSSSCPRVVDIVFSVVKNAVEREPRMAASLLRLHFHDCFVNGCDASDLLDDTSNFHGEKNAAPNRNSLRGFEIVDSIKLALEQECPKTVSCADILTLAARDSVVLSGGPWWVPLLGRRDSLDASQSEANQALPGPTDTLDEIVAKFEAVGLSADEVVILSGAHTIGKARCDLFSNRLYNFQNMAQRQDPMLSSKYASYLMGICPTGNEDISMTSDLDPYTPSVFDNVYYQNLLRGEGLLQSDQELFASGMNNVNMYSRVSYYASNKDGFFSDFAKAMIRMSNIKPLVGTGHGEIRRNCRFVNSNA